MPGYILEMNGITKEFPGVKALENVNFKVERGEIHALCGENGAGKSTLMKVLSGVHPFGTYSGDIIYEGATSEYKSIKDSEHDGIVIIHQELALIPELTIAENIFLGNEQAKRGIIDWTETDKSSQELLKKVRLDESPHTQIKHIGVGKQQLTEIAKALSKDVKLLILDEPTAALNEADSENLLQLLLELKAQGITSIIISHKLNEIIQVADSITILRDGKTIETISLATESITEDRIIKGMVGRDLENRYPERKAVIGERLLEIKNWTVFHSTQPDRKVVDQLSLTVKRGEVVGIAGLMGAGRTEFAMSVFGQSYGRNITGQVLIQGKEVQLPNVSKAIEHGLAYATEDRKNYGLVLMDTVKRNITLANLKKLASFGVIQENEEGKAANELKHKLNIKAASVEQETMNLSGGNQQKVVLSKWIFSDPEILILDEPTRGIDVGAKYEIYSIINQLASSGKGILLISSELPELIGMCDRLYTMSEGRITGEFPIQEATQETLMTYMTKGRRE